MRVPVSERVRKRRQSQRDAGLRPLQIWIFDTRKPGFTEECRRQSEIVAAADADDPDLSAFVDAVLEDINGTGA